MINGSVVFAKPPIETVVFEESIRLGRDIGVKRDGRNGVWLSYDDIRLEDLIRIMDIYYSGDVKLSVINEFDGLMLMFGDGFNGHKIKRNGVSFSPAAVSLISL